MPRAVACVEVPLRRNGAVHVLIGHRSKRVRKPRQRSSGLMTCVKLQRNFGVGLRHRRSHAAIRNVVAEQAARHLGINGAFVWARGGAVRTQDPIPPGLVTILTAMNVGAVLSRLARRVGHDRLAKPRLDVLLVRPEDVLPQIIEEYPAALGVEHVAHADAVLLLIGRVADNHVPDVPLHHLPHLQNVSILMFHRFAVDVTRLRVGLGIRMHVNVLHTLVHIHHRVERYKVDAMKYLNGIVQSHDRSDHPINK
mmetsp:Transcript_94847/g.159348  ORF Transcript_94847/g.159348 Transcript_94847/m.159348 type:complete len:253 (-) Transcript_94847:13-771(-)